jgi:RNA polymerase sigma factor (sigma-70 family)
MMRRGTVTQRIDELTHAIAEGSAEALTTFYGDWFDWMYATARTITRRDEAFCLDVVQDSMLRVIKSIRRMETQADLERWLTTVVKRAAIDRMRRDARQAARERSVGPRRDNQPTMKVTTEECAWLRQALRQLGPLDQELLTARHRFEWTLAEIGAARGQSPGAVHGRIGRVLATLRRHAREAFDGT